MLANKLAETPERRVQLRQWSTYRCHVHNIKCAILAGTPEFADKVSCNLVPHFTISISELVDTLIQCADLLVCQRHFRTIDAYILACNGSMSS